MQKKSKVIASNNGKLYCGVPGVEFIYHNEWSDPEVAYEGKLYNVVDLEEGLLYLYKEEFPDDPDYKNFHTWLSENPDYVYNELYDLTPSGDDTRTHKGFLRRNK